MSLVVLADLLKTMDSVGITEAVMEPTDNDGTLIRAANKDRNVIIFHEVPESIVDMPMGVQSVKGLLGRIMLFDLDKASLDFRDNGTEISDLTIKQGRKKATFRFADTDKLSVPKRVPEETPVSGVVMAKEYVDYLNSAIGAMSYTGTKQTQTISIGVSESIAEVTVFDGESDSFVDHFNVDAEDVGKGVWEVAPFKTVMGQSVKYSDDASASLSIRPTHKIAVFNVGAVDVMVSPIA